MKSKKILPYFIFVMSGMIIDYTLINYHLYIPYSFAMLFLNICLYELRFKQMAEDNKYVKVIVKVVGFIIMPVIYSLINSQLI